MMVKKRIEINIETRRTWMVRPVRAQDFYFCERCNEPVRMISADEAAIMIRVSPRVIYRWVETDEIHFAETSRGLILICLNSLNRADEAAMRQRFDALHE